VATAVPWALENRKARRNAVRVVLRKNVVTPKEQALPRSNTAFHQLRKRLSTHEFEAEAKKHHVGQAWRSATRWDQFIGMTMSQLSGRQSLRDIQSTLEAQRHKLYHLGAKPIARSTLARLNEKHSAALYEAVFYRVLKRCQS